MILMQLVCEPRSGAGPREAEVGVGSGANRAFPDALGSGPIPAASWGLLTWPLFPLLVK